MTSNDIRWLYDGNRKTGLSVRPDPKWAGMWRIHYPDGEVSDMVNISRATDAGRMWLRQNSPHHRAAETFRWIEGGLKPSGGRPQRVSESKA